MASSLASSELWVAPARLVSLRREVVQGFPRLAVMFHAFPQMFVVAILLQLWKQRLKRGFSVTDQSVIQFCATAELFSPNVDLNNGGVLRKELLIREVGADH